MTGTDIRRPPPKMLVDHHNFVRLKDEPPGESVTWMAYGDAKSGKTFFMASARKRQLFINNGGGMETLRSPLCLSKYPEVNEALTVTIEDRYDDKGEPLLNARFDMMSDAIDYGLQHFGEEFDTICVDDSTAARRDAMRKGLLIAGDTEKSKQMGKLYEKYDVLLPAVQDYNVEMSLILQFLMGTIEIAKKNKKHLIVGAHERHTFQKPAKIGDQPTLLRVRPGFTGQTMPDDIGGLWDVLTHTERVGGGSNTVYRHRFNGDEITQAGIRYGGIFETVESNVDFLKAVERIRAAQKNPKAPGFNR